MAPSQIRATSLGQGRQDTLGSSMPGGEDPVIDPPLQFTENVGEAAVALESDDLGLVLEAVGPRSV